MELIDIFPIAVSVTALIVSIVFSVFTLRDRRRIAQLARERDLHDWAQKLSDCYEILRAETGVERERSLVRLSVLIDYGRMFFPNDRTQEEIEEGKVGRRSSVLDPLVETVKREGKDAINVHKCRQDWREFTNQIAQQATAFQIDTSPESTGKKKYENP